MKKVQIARMSELDVTRPAHALVGDVDLVIVRWPDQDEVSVLYGRCLHRGALLAEGTIRGEDLICGFHDWERCHPQPYDRNAYQGQYADPHGTPDEPFNHWLQEMAEQALAHAGPSLVEIMSDAELI